MEENFFLTSVPMETVIIHFLCYFFIATLAKKNKFREEHESYACVLPQKN